MGQGDKLHSSRDASAIISPCLGDADVASLGPGELIGFVRLHREDPVGGARRHNQRTIHRLPCKVEKAETTSRAHQIWPIGPLLCKSSTEKNILETHCRALRGM